MITLCSVLKGGEERAPCKSSEGQPHRDALRNVLQLQVDIKMTIQNQVMVWIHATWKHDSFKLCAFVGCNVALHEPRRCKKHWILRGCTPRLSSPALTWTAYCRHITHQLASWDKRLWSLKAKFFFLVLHHFCLHSGKVYLNTETVSTYGFHDSVLNS